MSIERVGWRCARRAGLGAASALSSLLVGVMLGCSGSSGSTTTTPASLSLSASSLTFASQTVGVASASQTVTATNSGQAALTLGSLTLGGTNASSFAESSTCGASLAPAASCVTTVTFLPLTTGALAATLTFTDNAANSPQMVSLAGTATAVSGLNVDCSVAAGLCPVLTPSGDSPSAGGFHGFVDPSMRKDPNSPNIYLAYSWPNVLADGTHAVNLHLAHSIDGGATFTADGALYTSQPSTQNSSTAYGTSNDSSTEVVDLFPIAQGSATMWVQVHLSYLVPAKSASLYTELYPTSYISVSAVSVASPAASGAPQALLGLATAPEARLGTSDTDATFNVTQNLSKLNASLSTCALWNEPSLYYQGSTLYMALECNELPGVPYDANELVHFMFSTTPAGTDASKWTWSYVGAFAPPAQADKLGAVEGIPYQYFSQMELVTTQAGQPAVVVSAIVAGSGAGTETRYGCRVIPLTSFAAPSLLVDVNGNPIVDAKVTETDLYTTTEPGTLTTGTQNTGPAACTYEPQSSSGIVMTRKLDGDPTAGFFVDLVKSGLRP